MQRGEQVRNVGLRCAGLQQNDGSAGSSLTAIGDNDCICW